MPAQCVITGKTYNKVTKRSKSMRGTGTRLKANLQKVKIGNRQFKISARGLRILKKRWVLPTSF